MIRAVLFDLDGTLLDIDLDSFLGDYFGALGPVLAKITGLPARSALGALRHATNAMFEPHPGRTNRNGQPEGLSGDQASQLYLSGWEDLFPLLDKGREDQRHPEGEPCLF